MPSHEERIAQLAPNWLLQFKCLATDPAVPWWLEVEEDKAVQQQILAVHLEATANAYKALADGASKFAAIAAKRAK